jgi:hypothetical protein
MPGNQSDSPVVFEAANRELKTRKDYFAQIEKPVIGIEWEKGIEVGANIKSGQLLAQIVWDDATQTPILAPSKCTGRIDWKNGQIEYEWLHLQPQTLLRLAAPKIAARRKRTVSKRFLKKSRNL